MQNKIYNLLTIAAVCLCTCLNAQVKTKIFYTDIPDQYSKMLKKVSKNHKIEAPKGFYELKEKSKKIKDEDIEFALPVKQKIDFLKEAVQEISGELVTYSLTINATDALNLSLQFSEFKIPGNSVFSIHTKNEITDSITANENNENNIWATRVYREAI